MLREFAIAVYLTVFRIVFSFFKLFPLQNKSTFVASFGGNVSATVKALENQLLDHPVVILKTPKCKVKFNTGENCTILQFKSMNLVDYVRSIYHLATSKYIFIDNYYGFLAVTNFKADVKCVQLWHANGAMKQFGLEDLSNEFRSERAMNRFQKVYDRFDYVTIGSEKMKEIFKRSFGLPKERFIRTGIPRTDFFFNDMKRHRAEVQIQTDFPILNKKKMILYAPTYRDGEFATDYLELDVKRLEQEFSDDYVLFLRLHPAVKSKFDFTSSDFVFDVSNYPSINHLLVGADVLITDYSSIPFEFCLLDRPMIFYAYDLEDYRKSRGLIRDYEQVVPGPIVKTTDEIVEVIKHEAFEMKKLRTFINEWNLYSNGFSSERVVQMIYEEYMVEEERIREHG